MEERVHPIPFRTWKLSSPSPMILHNVMWESRPLPTSFKKPFAAKARRAFCRSVARYSCHLAQPDSFLFPMLFIWAASGGQGFVLARVFGLVARLNGMCPAGIAAFHFMLFWPPPAGADGGLLGAAAPPRPPLHSPRTTPLGLSYIPTPTAWPVRAFHIPSFSEGCAASAAGASSLRSAISLRAAQCQRAPPR